VSHNGSQKAADSEAGAAGCRQPVVASAATLWLPRSAWSQPRWPANPFTLGVASGAATPSSVLLWTRLHLPGVAAASLGPAPITVRWELADDEGFRRIVHSGQTLAPPELAHSVHLAGARPGP